MTSGTDAALTLHEDDSSITVPLTPEWTDVVGVPISASAAVDDGGAVRVELVMRATPHRLELSTDPVTSTFRATWPLFPLFGLGVDPVLSQMRPPA